MSKKNEPIQQDRCFELSTVAQPLNQTKSTNRFATKTSKAVFSWGWL